jgi:membrane-associated phospholipid phosphatase
MRIIAAAMIASTLAGIMANASRLTTGRTRPKESPKIEHGFYGPWHNGELLIGRPAYNSFPSGHTATAFGLAAVVLFASPAVGVLALAGAGLVAWSSIAMGAHHPSDVTVSVILSIAVAWFVWRWMSGPRGDWIEKALRLPAREEESAGHRTNA